MSITILARRAVRVGLAAALALTGVLLSNSPAEAAVVPPVLVGLDGTTGRIALFSSATGKVVTYLTPASRYDEGLPTYTWGRTSVLFVRNSNGTLPQFWGTFLVPAAGGTATQIITAPYGGAQPIASGPKGSFAGNLGQVATKGIEVTNAAKHKVVIYGTRDTPDDALAWSPDGVHLAVGTIRTTAANAGVHIVDTRLAGPSIGLGAMLACPTTLTGCSLRGAGYARDGSLYTVAVKGTAAYLARVAPGTKVPRVVVRLPGTALTYRVFVSPSGAVLTQAETWTGPGTRSAFVAVWNGATLRRLPATILEPAW